MTTFDLAESARIRRRSRRGDEPLRRRRREGMPHARRCSPALRRTLQRVQRSGPAVGGRRLLRTVEVRPRSRAGVSSRGRPALQPGKMDDHRRTAVRWLPCRRPPFTSHVALHAALWDLQRLLKGWVSPKLAVGPAAKRWRYPEQAATEEGQRRVASLPPLPANWEPDDPQLRAFIENRGNPDRGHVTRRSSDSFPGRECPDWPRDPYHPEPHRARFPPVRGDLAWPLLTPTSGGSARGRSPQRDTERYLPDLGLRRSRRPACRVQHHRCRAIRLQRLHVTDDSIPMSRS